MGFKMTFRAYQISNDGIFIDINHIDNMNILEGKTCKNAFTLMTYSTMKEREINNKNLKSYVSLLKKENYQKNTMEH